MGKVDEGNEGCITACTPSCPSLSRNGVWDFDVKIGNTRNRLQLSLDIMNVGNLFNSKWGVAKNMGSCNNGQVLKVNKVENNTPVFSMMKVNGEYATKTWNFNHNYDQCWKMQIGIKYTFN